MNTINLSQYSCLFWDLDGTLTESGPGITNCVKYALESFGIHETDENKLKLFIGPTLLYSFTEFYGFDEAKARQAIAKYRERFSTIGLFENSVYEGIHETLKELKNRGFRMFVATGKPEIFMGRILDKFELTQYFEFAAGTDLEETRTHKDQVIRFVIDKIGLEEERKAGKILMIGDRKHDIEGARKNGMDCAGVLWGYGTKEELTEHKAKYIINTPSELLA
ncbi:MAG: HAD hydrolase-like protein [Treponema sp.]|nr:HAD hydrolase-like protein [Candidatus Treponema equifaecale]